MRRWLHRFFKHHSDSLCVEYPKGYFGFARRCKECGETWEVGSDPFNWGV